jgi:two-component system, NarL family, response regulator LiaR
MHATATSALDSPSTRLLPRTSGTIRILLVDDHPVLRAGLSEFLGDQPDMTVVGEAADGQAAVDMAMLVRPDVILMDVTMPRMSGIEATRLIVGRSPEVRVIGLSMHGQDDMASAMHEAGAVEYLTKSGSSDGLLKAIRRVME